MRSLPLLASFACAVVGGVILGANQGWLSGVSLVMQWFSGLLIGLSVSRARR